MLECTSSATRRRSSLPDEAASVFADHAAGAPLRPAVAAAMVAALNGGPPNPSGAHRAARSAAMVLDGARRRIADELGADAADVVLTGGGTESCALGLLGPRNPSAVCISAIEHVAVRRAAEVAAARRGVELIVLPVDSQGRFDLEAALALVPDGALVSVMAANNETGVIEPIAELSRALRADRSILLHCDAIAAAPFSSIAELWPDVDLLSIAGHKVGGPPGVGVLVASRDLDLEAIVPGGSQESGRRAGTQDVAGATGLAVALEEVARERQLGQIAELAHAMCWPRPCRHPRGWRSPQTVPTDSPAISTSPCQGCGAKRCWSSSIGQGLPRRPERRALQGRRRRARCSWPWAWTSVVLARHCD